MLKNELKAKLSTYKKQTVEHQITSYKAQKFFEASNVNNKWVDTYYRVIKQMQEEGKPIESYSKLKISKYVKNTKTSINVWKYCRHHIDEIKISGAIYAQHFETKEQYKNDLAILVTFDEHLFLHYIIVMAETTAPNSGMLVVGLRWSFDTIEERLNYWDNQIKKMCSKYNVKYDSSWKNKLKNGPELSFDFIRLFK